MAVHMTPVTSMATCTKLARTNRAMAALIHSCFRPSSRPCTERAVAAEQFMIVAARPATPVQYRAPRSFFSQVSLRGPLPTQISRDASRQAAVQKSSARQSRRLLTPSTPAQRSSEAGHMLGASWTCWPSCSTSPTTRSCRLAKLRVSRATAAPCASPASCIGGVSSRCTWRYHAATARRTCSAVTCCSEPPSFAATASTCTTSSGGTGRESFSVSSSSLSCCSVGGGPSPMPYLVSAAPTDFGMFLKAYHTLRAPRSSSGEMQSSWLASATRRMYRSSSSLTGLPPL
mmetsp:Transcript_49688/g.158954  ORF Transcript_49688/g.158954 Transcript_49688/m.158954 type:complete len:288 (-) Transcript_49688:271-1134(-)